MTRLLLLTLLALLAACEPQWTDWPDAGADGGAERMDR